MNIKRVLIASALGVLFGVVCAYGTSTSVELRCVSPERNEWVLVDIFHFSREGDYCSKERRKGER